MPVVHGCVIGYSTHCLSLVLQSHIVLHVMSLTSSLGANLHRVALGVCKGCSVSEGYLRCSHSHILLLSGILLCDITIMCWGWGGGVYEFTGLDYWTGLLDWNVVFFC